MRRLNNHNEPENILDSKWFKTRPKQIQEMVRKRPPAKYLMLSTGLDYYVPFSYCEDGTLTAIRFDHRTDKVMWRVFGINPDKLLLIPENSEGK